MKRRHSRSGLWYAIAAGLVIGASAYEVRAQCEVARITDSIPAGPGERTVFGSGIEIDGTTAVVAGGQVNSPSDPRVSILTFADDRWDVTAVLHPPIPTGNFDFGGDVSIGGDTMVATGRETIIHVYRRVADVWSFDTTLLIPDPQGNPNPVVAADDDVILVGQPGAAPTQQTLGGVYVFDRIDDAWIAGEVIKPATTFFRDDFGRIIAYDGERLVTTSRRSLGAPSSGHDVHVFERIDGIWINVQTIGLIGEPIQIAVDGTTIALIESINDVRHLTVLEFDEDAGTWMTADQFQPDVPSALFGRSVAIDRDVIAVSGPTHDVLVYQRGEDGWFQSAELDVDGLSNDSEFGRSLDLHGDQLLVGDPNAFRTFGGSVRAGAVFDYRGISGPDCDANGVPDACDVRTCSSLDIDGNGVLDGCEAGAVVFIGPPGGSWLDPSHWSSGVIPSGSDQVVLTKHVSIDGAVAARSITVACGGRLDMVGGAVTTVTLSLADGGALTGFGTVDATVMHDGLIEIGDGELMINGDLMIGSHAVTSVRLRDIGDSSGLTVHAPVTLAGTLRFTTTPTETLGIGVDDAILTATKLMGDFDRVEHDRLPTERRVRHDVIGTELRIVIDLNLPVSTCRVLRPSDEPNAVAIHGDVALLGTTAYRRTKTGWHVEQELNPDNATVGLGLRGLTVDEDLVVIGDVFFTHDGESQSGTAFVYRHVEDGWVLDQQLFSAVSQSEAEFGYTIAYDDGILAIGSPATFTNGPTQGAIDVFREVNGAFVHEAYIESENTFTETWFGLGLAVSDGRIFVGGPPADCLSGSSTGDAPSAVYVYAQTGAAWTLVDEIRNTIPTDAFACDYFGFGLDVDGDIAAIRSFIREPPVGDTIALDEQVQIFRFDGSTWNLEMYASVRKSAFVWFPTRSVAVDGETVYFGAFETEFENDLQFRTGRIHVFRRGGSAWIEEPSFIASDGCEQLFGFLIDADQGRLVTVSGQGSEAGMQLFEGTDGLDLNGNGVADACEDSGVEPPPSTCFLPECREDCAPLDFYGEFGNGVVNVDDMLAVINRFGLAGAGEFDACDIDLNGTVDVDDLIAVIVAFGQGPECGTD
ncbi:MAG: hypothetical protein AAF432_08735 [Planctomycetota bacterium]